MFLYTAVPWDGNCIESDTRREVASELGWIDRGGPRGHPEGFLEDDPEPVPIRKLREVCLMGVLCGDADCQRELAWWFDPENESSCSVPRDEDMAMYWYQRAAENGDGMAAHNLGCKYMHTDEDWHDCTMARHWFRKAVAVGFEKSRKMLQRCENCKRGR